MPLLRKEVRERYPRGIFFCNSQARGNVQVLKLVWRLFTYFSVTSNVCLRIFQRADPCIIVQPVQARRMENSEKALDWASGSGVPFLVMPKGCCSLCTLWAWFPPPEKWGASNDWEGVKGPFQLQASGSLKLLFLWNFPAVSSLLSVFWFVGANRKNIYVGWCSPYSGF